MSMVRFRARARVMNGIQIAAKVIMHIMFKVIVRVKFIISSLPRAIVKFRTTDRGLAWFKLQARAWLPSVLDLESRLGL